MRCDRHIPFGKLATFIGKTGAFSADNEGGYCDQDYTKCLESWRERAVELRASLKNERGGQGESEGAKEALDCACIYGGLVFLFLDWREDGFGGRHYRG